MKYFTIFWTMLAFALCGCSDSTSPSAKFLQLLSKADRLEVANRDYVRLGETNSHAAFTITGADVIKLTTAIKSAKKHTPDTSLDWESPFSWDVEFYARTNELADIPICYGVFRIESIEYIDGTGVIENFWKKLEADMGRPH